MFQQAFIPKRLDEVDAFERDQRRLKASSSAHGDGAEREVGGVYYQSITGMKHDLSGVETTPKILKQKAAKDREARNVALSDGLTATSVAASAKRREARKSEADDDAGIGPD